MAYDNAQTTARAARLPVLAAALLAVAACTPNEPLTTNTSTTPGSQQSAAPSFAQFSDIPIPPGAKMDVGKTRVFGGSSSWIGDLYFSAGLNQSKTFDFFKADMPSFGWTEITTVRALRSVMTYEQNNRIANIAIEDSTLSGAQVIITVSPRSTPQNNTARPMSAAPMSGGSPGVGAPPPGYAAPGQ